MKQAVFILPVAAVAVLFLAAPQPAHAATAHSAQGSGAAIFKANCVVCHGVDGGGSAVGKGLHAPDLRSTQVQKQSDSALERFIAAGSGAMPAFKNTLSDRQIDDVVHHIRHLAKH